MAMDNNHLIGLSILKTEKTFDIANHSVLERLHSYLTLLPN